MIQTSNCILCVKNVFVARTVTHSALGGLVSCRDFVDVVVVERNDEFLATLGQLRRTVLAVAERVSVVEPPLH